MSVDDRTGAETELSAAGRLGPEILHANVDRPSDESASVGLQVLRVCTQLPAQQGTEPRALLCAASRAQEGPRQSRAVRGGCRAPPAAQLRCALRRATITAAARNEVFCVASFRIVARLQKPAFWIGAPSRLVHCDHLVPVRRNLHRSREAGATQSNSARTARTGPIGAELARRLNARPGTLEEVIELREARVNRLFPLRDDRDDFRTAVYLDASLVLIRGPGTQSLREDQRKPPARLCPGRPSFRWKLAESLRKIVAKLADAVMDTPDVPF